MELYPAPVPATAQQAGDRTPRAWAEPSVWTDRMLSALEQGVKGGVWFRLVDKVFAPRNLEAAWAKVRANEGAAGMDRQTVEQFERDQDDQLRRLHEQLRTNSYQPQPIRRTYIDKPGSAEQRPLGIPAVRDRIVQKALVNVLEPIWEVEFAEQSYGFRPGRSCKDALRRVEQLMQAGYTYVVDADLKSYFDTIPHDRLMTELRQRIADGRVLGLIEAFLKAKVMDGLKEWEPTMGSPQGAVLSPLLSNVFLNPVDHAMAAAGFEMVRYADDFVILCRSREEAERALTTVQQLVETRGLVLHPDKTRLVDMSQAGEFEFLGYRFTGKYRWPRRKSLTKIKDKIRAVTKRTSGLSLEAIIQKLNPILRGWFNYFKHSTHHVFRDLDGWIRMRLRSLLRKRQGRSGRGRGADHHRWPNAFFATQGLYNLTTALHLAWQLR